MASPNDPSKPSRRSRANGMSPTPLGAQAQSDPAQPNSVGEEARVEVGRDPRRRPSGPVLNAIEAVAEAGSSKSPGSQSPSSLHASIEPPQRAIPERVA